MVRSHMIIIVGTNAHLEGMEISDPTPFLQGLDSSSEQLSCLWL